MSTKMYDAEGYEIDPATGQRVSNGERIFTGMNWNRPSWAHRPTSRKGWLGWLGAIVVLLLALWACSNLTFGNWKLPTQVPTAATQTVAAPTKAPAATRAPATVTSTPALSDGSALNWKAFKSMLTETGMENPYDLIDWLDARQEKKDHPAGGWTVNAQASLVWTGMYVDDVTLGGKAYKLLTDGKTGVFVVEKGTVVPTPGGEIPLTGWDDKIPTIEYNTNREAVDVSAKDCLEAQTVKSVIEAAKAINLDQVFSNLDALVDNNQSARLRAGGPGNVSVTNQQALIWTQPSAVGTGATKLLESNGKALFVATSTGTLNVNHAFSGIRLCGNYDGTTATKPEVKPEVKPTAAQSVKPTAMPSTGTGGATTNASCVNTSDVVAVINANKGNPDALYAATGKFSAVKYPAGSVSVKWLTSLIIVANSATGDVVALDVTQLSNGQIRGMYLATTDGTANVTHEFWMLTLCSPLDPAKEFPWWGK